MDDDELKTLIETIRVNARPHAGYFAWRSDRDLEEYGVVQSFHESLQATGEVFFDAYDSRGAGNDPPDCEATAGGDRIGIEVTELVDGNAISAAEAGHNANWWPPFEIGHLVELISERIDRKDNPSELKGGPYAQYILLIYCDEPRVLNFDLLRNIRDHKFSRPNLIDRAFLLLSYDPGVQRCPYIELNWAAT